MVTAVNLGRVSLTSGCPKEKTYREIGFRAFGLQEIVTCTGTFISWARKKSLLPKGRRDFFLHDQTK